MSNLVVIGASRGLGAALAIGLPKAGDKVWAVSRTKPDYLSRDNGIERVWIEADLSSNNAITTIVNAIGQRAIDTFIYNAGIWENDTFENSADSEIRSIVDTNLTSLLLCIKHLTPNIRSATHSRIVFIGSTCGLENEGAKAVAYTATKFAMRGAAHSLREVFRDSGISVTCISPGSMATDISYDDGPDAALKKYEGKRIPVHDIVNLIRCIISMSAASCIKEVDIPATLDTDV
jgi:short-subunit dehydrogenase